jgi:hypothetical protein
VQVAHGKETEKVVDLISSLTLVVVSRKVFLPQRLSTGSELPGYSLGGLEMVIFGWLLEIFAEKL